MQTTLSIIIPLHNEAKSLLELHNELTSVAKIHDYQLDIILVDDGSTDNSWQIIKQLSTNDPHVLGVRLGNNFGKASALSAGIEHAKNELIITMDADLQDDPANIPTLVSAINQNNLDIVIGWRKSRQDKQTKIFVSFVFNYLVNHLTNIKLHDINCGMKCCRRHIFDEIQLYGELHRFLPVLAAAKGRKVGETIISHRPRKHGRSKYGTKRFIKGFIDLFTVKLLVKFGQRPQHILGTMGILSLILGLIALIITIIQAVPSQQNNTYFIISASLTIIFSLTGTHLITTGFLAEIITAYHGQKYKPYSITELTNKN